MCYLLLSVISWKGNLKDVLQIYKAAREIMQTFVYLPGNNVYSWNEI